MPTEEIKKHLTANVFMRKREIMAANFLGGLAWGLGTVIGATVFVAVLLGVLRFLGFVPVIGEFVTQIKSDIESRHLPTGPLKEENATPAPAPQFYLLQPAPTPSASASAKPTSN